MKNVKSAFLELERVGVMNTSIASRYFYEVVIESDNFSGSLYALIVAFFFFPLTWGSSFSCLVIIFCPLLQTRNAAGP